MQSHSDRNPTVRRKEAGGLLRSYIPDFTDAVAERGYQRVYACRFRVVQAFNRWMRQRQIKMEGCTEKRIQGFIRDPAKRGASVRERHALEARCALAATGTALSETRGQLGSVLSSGIVIGDAPCGVKSCSQLMMATAESGNGR